MALCVAAFFLQATAVRAELWGFIDDQGQPRFATHRVDERYQLFFKGGSSLDPARIDAGATARAALERSPLYQRILNHPNARRFASLIEQHAKAQRLDVALVKAMIAVESAFDPAAVSPKGALGLMQVLAAYNAGEQAVHQYGDQVPPYPETREYVALVRQFQMLYQPTQRPAPKGPRPTLVFPAGRPVQSTLP